MFGTLVWVALLWFYGQRLEGAQERNELLNERLSAQDELLQGQREQLQISQTTSYSKLTNRELRDKALVLALRINELREHYLREDRALSDEQFSRPLPQSREESDNKFKADRAARDAVTRKWEQAYAFDYKAEAVAVRQELQARLPASARQEVPDRASRGLGGRRIDYFDTANLAFDLPDIVIELERLAKLLPVKTD